MSRFIITEYENFILAGLWNDKRAVTIDLIPKDDYIRTHNEDVETPVLGDIYIGKVKKLLKAEKSCFVDIKAGFSCFLPLDRGSVIYTDGHRSDPKCECVREGDELVVQVAREATGNKKPVLSCFFNLPLYDNPRIKFHEIVNKAATRTCYTRLYHAPDKLTEIIMRSSDENIEMIRTDIYEVFNILSNDEFLRESGKYGLLSLYTDEYPLSKLYGVNAQMKLALDKKIYLKSGANIVIEKTEALWSVDVNSAGTDKRGKDKADREKLYLETNMEAADEIAAQMILRNMSGIIIIDFINMSEESSREKLLCHMTEVCEKDSLKVHILGFTSLGLMEISRKRVKKPLYEIYYGS